MNRNKILILFTLFMSLNACQPKKSSNGSSTIDASNTPNQPSSPTHAENSNHGDSDCTYFRLDEKQKDGSDGSMVNVPVRDQGPFGICYGEVASQLNDAYRFGVLNDTSFHRHTAVLSTVIGENETTGNDPYNGGTICAATNYIKEAGYRDAFSVAKCIERDESKEVVLTLSKYYDDYYTDIGKLGTSAEKSARKQVLAQDVISWLIAKGVPSDEQPTADDIMYVAGLRKLRFIWGIEAFQCFKAGELFQSNLPQCKPEDLSVKAAPDRRQQIDALLIQHRGQPLGISYCDQVLTEGVNYPGAIIDSQTGLKCTPRLDASGKPMSGNGRHASMIIGRRKNTANNKCQYLVRNSWGSSCDTTPPHITLPPDLLNDPALPFSYRASVNKKSIYSPDWDCDKGNIWVDADVLTKSIYGVSYLKP